MTTKTASGRLLKGSVLLFAFIIFTLLVLWWNRTSLANMLIDRTLASQGFENSEVRLKDINTHQLLISATVYGSGWEVHVGNATVAYDWRRLFNQKQIDSIEVESLQVLLNSTETPDEEDTAFSLAILQNVPVRNIRIDQGKLSAESGDGVLDAEWAGHWSLHEGNIELWLSALQADYRSADRDKIFVIPRVENPDGLLRVTLDPQRQTGAFRIAMEGFNLEGTPLTIEEGMLTADLYLADWPPGEINLGDKAYLREQFLQLGSGTLSFSADRLTAPGITSNWVNLLMQHRERPDSDSLNIRLTGNAGTVAFTGETLEGVTVEVESGGSLEALASQGFVAFLFEGIEGRVDVDQLAKNLMTVPSLEGRYLVKPMTFDYSDALGRHLPNFNGLIFSGTLSAEGDYTYSNESFDASAFVGLSGGSLLLPQSDLEATGIEARLPIRSARQMTSDPGESSVSIDLIQVADLRFHETQINFDLLDSSSIFLSDGHTKIFEGRVNLTPTTITKNPLSFDTTLEFERLSLKAIVEGMKFFNGTMTGSVSGQLPLAFRNGSFGTDQGFLALPEGETARLNYNTEGLFAPSEPTETAETGFLQNFSDKLMGKLKLAPENVVEDALANLTVHEFRIDLLSSDTPETPVRIHLAGEGLSGKTKVPLILDTNINGTMDELMQFLLRIHSLGTPSLD